MKELTTYQWVSTKDQGSTGFAEGAECTLMNFSQSLKRAYFHPQSPNSLRWVYLHLWTQDKCLWRENASP